MNARPMPSKLAGNPRDSPTVPKSGGNLKGNVPVELTVMVDRHYENPCQESSIEMVVSAKTFITSSSPKEPTESNARVFAPEECDRRKQPDEEAS